MHPTEYGNGVTCDNFLKYCIKPYPDDLEGLQIFRQSQPKTQYGQVDKTD
jgi:hypothetical protein